MTMFAACSEDDAENGGKGIDVVEQPVVFDATGDGTRAFTGSINDIGDLHSATFGVYAYYTANADYKPGEWYPNFFFNQHVLWNDESQRWTYTPSRFWPNDVDSIGGKSKVSFFGYLPYVAPDLENGLLEDGFFPTADTVGIIAVSTNGVKSAPSVRYRSCTDSVQGNVDLMWAQPQLNITRPDSNRAVTLHFQHALARIGVSAATAGVIAPVNPDTGRIVYIKDITITANIPEKGVLALNSTQKNAPQWQNTEYADGDSTTIVIDDRSITRSLRDVDYGDLAGYQANKSSELWQHNCQQGGVNAATRYVMKAFSSDDDATGSAERTYFMVIPCEGVTMHIKVRFSVTTFGPHTYHYELRTVEGVRSGVRLRAGRTTMIRLTLPLEI